MHNGAENRPIGGSCHRSLLSAHLLNRAANQKQSGR
eukprot:SAG11_NODE_16475_length_546_cov_1.136465_1_plen_35_part_10